MPRPFKKRDENEPAIVAALVGLGAIVCRIENFGVPDLLVGYRGRTILLEVKNPDALGKRKKPRKLGPDDPPENAKNQLTPAQVEWWRTWSGGQAHVVETPEEAIAIVRGAELDERTMSIRQLEATIRGEPTIDITIRHFVRPDEADAIAGAIHEAAGIARARRKS